MLCECGCGLETKKNNHFIYGHSAKKASRKFVELRKGIKRSPEFCNKVKQSITNKWKNSEYRNKMMISRKAQWTQELRENMSKIATIRMNTPEAKLENSNRMRKRFQEDKEYRLNHSLKISKAVNEGRCGSKKAKRGYYLNNDNKIIYVASSYEYRMAFVLDNSKYKWEKCWDRIMFKDLAGYKRIYTPDFKIYLDDNNNNFIYLETKGFVDLKTFNKFNDIILYNNIPIFLLFNEDIQLLENQEDNYEINFNQFKTLEEYVEENYKKFWSF